MYGRLGVHPQTVLNCTEHFRAESAPRSEFASASRTESREECTVQYASVQIAHSAFGSSGARVGYDGVFREL